MIDRCQMPLWSMIVGNIIMYATYFTWNISQRIEDYHDNINDSHWRKFLHFTNLSWRLQRTIYSSKYSKYLQYWKATLLMFSKMNISRKTSAVEIVSWTATFLQITYSCKSVFSVTKDLFKVFLGILLRTYDVFNPSTTAVH